MTAMKLFPVLDVIVESAAHMHERINAAVEAVRELSSEHGRHGILVTQHSYTSYTVTLSPEVPFGMTMERRQLETDAEGRRR